MSDINVEFNNDIKYDDERAKEWLSRAIAGLTVLEQKVLALFYCRELKITEIADRVNLSPAGVRNTLAGARNTIRIQLKRQENATGLRLPEAIPASTMTSVINERMMPLLMEIEHDEERRALAERLRLEEQRRLEEQKLKEEEQKLREEVEKLEPVLFDCARTEEGRPSEEQSCESSQQFVIYGSPYEQDRRRAALGAMAAGRDVPVQDTYTPPVPPVWQAGTQNAEEPVPSRRDLMPDDDDACGSSGSRKSRIWLLLIVILAILLVVLGILVHKMASGSKGAERGAADAEPGSSSAAEPGDTGTDGGMTEAEKLEAARAEAAKAYLAVLDDMEGSLTNSTQFDGSYDNKISRPAALADIDGDGIEELFLLTSPDMGIEGNELHIYSFIGGEAKEIIYDHLGHQGFAHYEVAGGGDFAVYTGKEPGTLYIYECMVDDGISYSLVKYKYSGGTAMSAVTNLTNWYWDHGDPGTTVDEYKENGTPISIQEGQDRFSSSFADLDKAILFSAAKGTTEVSLWKYFDTANAGAMPYPDVRHTLESKVK